MGEVSLDGRAVEHVFQSAKVGIALRICAGGLVTDISPDPMILVSRTTRTWRSYCRDLCGNLLRGEGTQLLGGATQLTNHTPESLTTGLAFRRLQNHLVGSPPDRYRFAPREQVPNAEHMYVIERSATRNDAPPSMS